MSRLKDFCKGLFEDGKLLAITRANLHMDAEQGTRRFTEEELKRYAYRIVDGSLFNERGEKLLSSVLSRSHDKSGVLAFVIAVDGKIYLFNHLNKTDKVAHSSFVGAFARGAGEIMVSKGNIVLVHAHSGHFRPNALNIYHVVEHFRGLGVLSPQARVGFVSDPFSGIGLQPPSRTNALTLVCILDKQERDFLLDCQTKIKEAQSELTKLQGSLSADGFEPYRTNALQELVDAYETFSEPGMADFFGNELKGLQEKIEGMKSLTPEAHRPLAEQAIRRLRDNIEDSQYLVDSLTNRSEKIAVIYAVDVFLNYVREHWDVLRNSLKPAFYNQ